VNTHAEDGGNHTFLIGVIAGGVIGAGLVIALAPRLASNLRKRVKASATDLSQAASDGHQEVGAREVEQFAMASKTGQTTSGPAHRTGRANM